jgi:succinate dehydrogenase / fumarate reductase membrane anchor subunit
MIHPKAFREPGLGHWRWQRLSAVVTLALVAYFAYMVVKIGAMDFTQASAFVAAPFNGFALAVLVVVGLFHASLGVQMIIEDYIAIDSGRLTFVKLSRGLFALLACASLVSIVVIMSLF